MNVMFIRENISAVHGITGLSSKFAITPQEKDLDILQINMNIHLSWEETQLWSLKKKRGKVKLEHKGFRKVCIPTKLIE